MEENEKEMEDDERIEEKEDQMEDKVAEKKGKTVECSTCGIPGMEDEFYECALEECNNKYHIHHPVATQHRCGRDGLCWHHYKNQ